MVFLPWVDIAIFGDRDLDEPHGRRVAPVTVHLARVLPRVEAIQATVVHVSSEPVQVVQLQVNTATTHVKQLNPIRILHGRVNEHIV